MPSERFPTSKSTERPKDQVSKAEQVSVPNFSASLKAYIDSYEKGKPEGFLREHQQDVFHDIAAFLKKNHKAGYLDLPTGFGKTVVFVELVKAFSRDVEGKKPNLKTLVLVPTQDLIIQTIGKSEDPKKREGFAKFAPDIKVTPYYAEEKDLSGDVVVSTYDSFIRLQKEDPKFSETFHLVILDEAHKALGVATKEQIQAITPKALKIGCTATSEYDDKRKVSDILPERIHKMEVKEAVELGILANPRGFLYRTQIKIEGKVGKYDRGDYPPAVFRKLNNEARNKVTTDFAKIFVEKGLSGLIPCLPGEKGEHAREMAERISKETILDQKTKKRRNIIAGCITEETPRDERDKIYDLFKKGEIDCLTYIDIMTTGKDLPNAKFLIRNRPRKSKVTSVQETGRVLRPYESTDPFIVEIADEFPLGAEPYTVFDQFEVSTINQGQTMVDSEDVVELTEETSYTEKENLKKKTSRRLITPTLYTEAKKEQEKTKTEKSELNHKLIQELIGKMQVEAKLERELRKEMDELYPKAPEGWFTLDYLARKYHRIGDKVLELIQKNCPASLLKNEVREYSSNINQARVPRTHYGPKIIAIMDPILAHTQEVEAGTMTVNALAADIHAKDRRVKKIAESFRAEHPEWFTFHYSKEAGRDVEVLSKQLVSIIRKKIEKERKAFPEALPGEESAYMLAKRLDTTRIPQNNIPRIKKIAESFRESHPEWFNMRISTQGKPGEYYAKPLVKRIEKLF